MKVVGIDRDFFQFMFTKLYQERWESAGKSGREFAKEIQNRTEYSPTRQTVSDWKRGKKLPSKEALEAICNVLGVDESVFQPFSHPYAMRRYTSAFSDSVDKAMAKKAKDEYGIDLTFYEGLKNIIPDFGSHFPLNAPLLFYATDPPYARESHKGREKVKEKRLFQIERDRETIDLTDWDLKIIRLLQNKVSEIVVDWMDKTAAEMIADEKAVNLELAARNIPSVKTILPSNLNVKDLLEADFVIMTEAAVNDVTERLN